ncbi:MAG: amine oxidase [Candidatus Scalindua brodae]|uniref:Amine oxidase n=1 Tax=Candidatus Scalindua brodae TaxID=237368 RepID=A0A0B0EL52_9BACT|nr:MAG: amine oxidase [Candidatus Scalindua brodae]
MKNEKQATIILGGGLTGLSAAYHGGYTVYEGEEQIGGTCISPTVDGYTFDLGIHVLHTKNKYVLRLLQDKLGVNLKTQTRKAWIYSSGKLTRYPFQANTFGLPVPLVKSCLISFVENYCKQKNNKNSEYYNYEQWLIATFGEAIAKHFMIPYSEKFWTVHPRQITTEWLGTRIPLPSLEEVIEGALADQKKGFGPNATFRYPRKSGISAIPDEFHKSGIHVINNKKAVKIDLYNKEVFFFDGTKVNYEVLISTIPLPELTKLTSAPKDIAMESRRLKYNSILCVNIGINNDKLNDNHWIYYHEKKYSFFRISFLKNFASSLTPRGKSSITAEISYSKKKPIDKKKHWGYCCKRSNPCKSFDKKKIKLTLSTLGIFLTATLFMTIKGLNV